MFELCLCLYWQSNNRLGLTANGDFKNPESKHTETTASNTETESKTWTLDLPFELWKCNFEEKVLTLCLTIDSNMSDTVLKIIRTQSMHFR